MKQVLKLIGINAFIAYKAHNGWEEGNGYFMIKHELKFNDAERVASIILKQLLYHTKEYAQYQILFK